MQIELGTGRYCARKLQASIGKICWRNLSSDGVMSENSNAVKIGLLVGGLANTRSEIREQILNDRPGNPVNATTIANCRVGVALAERLHWIVRDGRPTGRQSNRRSVVDGTGARGAGNSLRGMSWGEGDPP